MILPPPTKTTDGAEYAPVRGSRIQSARSANAARGCVPRMASLPTAQARTSAAPKTLGTTLGRR